MIGLQCPCGIGYQYSRCCQPLLEGDRRAETAEQLMRSRYTAYVRKNIQYLFDSWHPSTRPQHLSAEDFADWQRLEILGWHRGRAGDNEGTVTFRALSKSGNSFQVLEETSRFVYIADRWLYVDGVIRNKGSLGNIGRNEMCPCGSGIKYKKCCRA